MKIAHGVLACLLLLMTGMYSDRAAGEATDSAATTRIAAFVELKADLGTAQKIIFLEALASMGDVGEGGGGLRKWKREFKSRYERRLKTNGPTTVVQAHEGRRFAFSKKRMPFEDFSSFQIKTIVEFKTRSQGNLSASSIYHYHLRALSADDPVNRPDLISDLISLETLEGLMIPVEEITDITVEFKVRP